MPPQQNPEGHVFWLEWSTARAFCKEKVVLFAVLGRPTSRSLNVVEPSTTNTSMCECTWTASEYLRLWWFEMLRESELKCATGLGWLINIDKWYFMMNDFNADLQCDWSNMPMTNYISTLYYERGLQFWESLHDVKRETTPWLRRKSL